MIVALGVAAIANVVLVVLVDDDVVDGVVLLVFWCC